MRFTTTAVVDRVQAMSSTPVRRAPEGFATACRLVSGQECFGSAAAVWQVESVSGTAVAGAAGFLGLVAPGAGLLERHGYVGLLGQERPRPINGSVGSGISGVSERDYDDSDKGDNGSKPMPMSPWDFRTSGPPG